MIELGRIFIFTALECEARPMIEFYRLKKNMQSLFPIYSANGIVLTVTGLGKPAMAAGVAYTLAFMPTETQPVMLNLGIAGHANWPLGTLAIAHKIVDGESQKRFYPALPHRLEIRSEELWTHSHPCTNYQASVLHDMEASAFYEIALKFSTVELCHCVKIVSDNIQHSVSKINSDMVKTWVAEQRQNIDDYIVKLDKLRTGVRQPKLLDDQAILETWHFSTAQQIRLRRLLQRWRTLTGYDWKPNFDLKPQSAQQVIEKIILDINQLNIFL
jgi:adenosylhomocysteine nucleosidase